MRTCIVPTGTKVIPVASATDQRGTDVLIYLESVSTVVDWHGEIDEDMKLLNWYRINEYPESGQKLWTSTSDKINLRDDGLFVRLPTSVDTLTQFPNLPVQAVSTPESRLVLVNDVFGFFVQSILVKSYTAGTP